MIYFIHNPLANALKIGHSADPDKRMGSLQTANAEELVLLGTIPGNQIDEATLHRRFASFRLRGEWFRSTPELMTAVRTIIARSIIERRPGKAPTFRALALLEPGLAELFTEARGHLRDRSPNFCANAVWYGYPGFVDGPALKERMYSLVGFGRPVRHSILSTPAAYEVAYDTIYHALPDCRGECACGLFWQAAVGVSSSVLVIGHDGMEPSP